MTESPQHLRGKHRLADLLRTLPNIWNVFIEYPTGIYVPSTLGPRQFIADVYAEHIVDVAHQVQILVSSVVKIEHLFETAAKIMEGQKKE